MPHPEAVATDAVLLVHVWLEPGHPQPLRARVCATDLQAPARFVLDPHGQAVSTSVEDLVRAIRIWLDELVTSTAARGSDAGVTPE
jgi:hypothetical protein